MPFIPEAEQLEHPEILDWFLDELQDAEAARDTARVEALTSLLDAPIIDMAMDGADEVQRHRLLRVLPDHRLAGRVDALLAEYKGWPVATCLNLAPALARLAPGGLRRCLGELLDAGGPDQPQELGGRAFAGLDALGSHGRELLTPALTLFREDHARQFTWLPYLVRTCLAAGEPGEAIGLLVFAWTDDPDSELPLDDALYEVSEHFHPRSPWYGHFREVVELDTEQRLASLPELFRTGAPLEELDRIARSVIKEEEPGLHDSLAQGLALLPGDSESPAAGFIHELHSRIEDTARVVQVAELSIPLVLGVVAAAHARPEREPREWSVSRISEVLAADLAPNPALGPAADALLARPPAQQTHLLSQALDMATGHGLRAVVELMGRTGRVEFLQPLLDALSMDINLDICQSVAHALLRLGPATEEELLARWELLDQTQRVHVAGVLGSLGGEPTITHLLEELPRLEGDLEALGIWCSVATRLPDPRLLAALEGELRRGYMEVEETYVTLCLLLGYRSPELDRLRRKLRDSRRRFPTNSDLEEQDGPAAAIRSTMDLGLRCSECGERARYEVRQVWMSPLHLDEAPYLGDDLTCRFCGAKDTLELAGGEAKLAITAQALAVTLARDQDLDHSGALKLVNTHLSDETEVSPAGAIDAYKRRLARDPDDVGNLVGLGNLYLRMGPARKAARCFERALELAPATPEAAQGLATYLEDAGEVAAAFEVLRQAHTVRHNWRFHRLNRNLSARDLEHAFAIFYNELADQLGEQGIPVPEPPRPPWFDDGASPLVALPTEPIRRSEPKVGRNAPCPCGSGKKYKKCCQRK